MKKITTGAIRSIPLDSSKDFEVDNAKATYSARNLCTYWNKTEGAKIGYRCSLEAQSETRVTIHKKAI